MYKIDPTNGDIHLEDGTILSIPYEDVRYQDYALWIQSGNTPEEFVHIDIIPVPESVSRFQAQAALLQAGFLDMIEAYMAAETTSRMEKLAWSNALEFRRDSPLMIGLCSAFGLTNEQVDNLFRLAATINA
jgi:hypothetical protein